MIVMNEIYAVIQVFTLCNSHKNVVRLISRPGLGGQLNFECFHWKNRMEFVARSHLLSLEC